MTTRVERSLAGNAGSRLIVLILALTLALPAALVSAQTPSSSPAVAGNDPSLATIKPALQGMVAAKTGDLTSYTIDATLRLDGSPGLDGTARVSYINTTGNDLDIIPFRLYANGANEDIDAVIVDDVTVDGQRVEPELTVSNSVLSVPLASPLAPDASVTIELGFSATVPIDTSDHYGIFGIDTATGTWALAHWYPIIAGWDPANGWELDPTSINGDPIFSNTALYDVTLTAPASWQVVTTGSAIDETVAGAARTQRFLSGPVRDFTIVADSDFQSVSTEVDGTRVTSWYNPGTDRVGKAVLEYAARALALYNELIGPYPYATFDIVPVELYGAAGVEFPQLVYIGQSYYSDQQNLSVPNYLDFTVSHEVLHQWFYGLIGNNQYIHAFTDEGLTNFISSKVYFTEVYGAQAGNQMFGSAVVTPFAATVTSGGDQIVDTPTDDFETGRAYSFAAYNKAPMGFNAIYETIGHDAFFAGLRSYYETFLFGIAQPDDLRSAFEQASDQDLGDLWRHWFEERAAEDDV